MTLDCAGILPNMRTANFQCLRSATFLFLTPDDPGGPTLGPLQQLIGVSIRALRGGKSQPKLTHEPPLPNPAVSEVSIRFFKNRRVING